MKVIGKLKPLFKGVIFILFVIIFYAITKEEKEPKQMITSDNYWYYQEK